MLGKFSLKEFFVGGGKESWFKSWGYGWRLILTLAILFFVGIVIWRAFFMKTTTVHVGKGGTAIINQVKKRFFIPFVEGGIEKNSDVDLDTYIRAGLRFEF